MRLLNCVSSFQRYHYLKNTVDSMLEYFRFGDTLIVDNGSEDPAVHGYLDDLEGRGIQVMRRGWEGEIDPDRPGHKEGMQRAVEFAADNDYDVIQFVEDDMQFMWHDPAVLQKVQRVFDSRPSAVQVSPLFFDKITTLPDTYVIDRELDCYRSGFVSWTAVGFTPVSKVSGQGIRFLQGETYEGQKGTQVYYLHSPVLTRIPWPSAYRSGELQGRMKPPVQRYYLKPLSSRQVNRLTSRPVSELHYHEDYCRAWGWAAMHPCWFFTRNDRDYTSRLVSYWRRQGPTLPRWSFAGVPRYMEPGFGVLLQLARTLVAAVLRLVSGRKAHQAPAQDSPPSPKTPGKRP